MRPLAVAAVFLAGCSAEQLSEWSVQETSHTATARFVRGQVVLSVTQTFENPGLAHGSLTQSVDLPDGAVVTALRVNGLTEHFLSSDQVADRWAELLAEGPADPTLSVKLERAYGGTLELSLFGLAPGATATVSYDAQLPPQPDHGEWSFARVAGQTLDLSQLPGARADDETVRFARPPIDRVDAKWATYRLGADRSVWRFELDAAEVLEPAPARPNVVFVIDASHSMGAAGIAAQVELMGPFLANAPDAQVEVVVYRRTAERLFGRFVPAADAARLLAEKPLPPGNGSNLEAGAQVAAEAIATASGPGRIVIFTDDALRDGFTNEAAITALTSTPRDVVVHLVTRTSFSGDLAESRQLEHPLAPIAEAHGGIVLDVSGRPEDPAEAAHTLLGLLRPVRIDAFRVEAKGLETDHLDVPDALDEGHTERLQAISAAVPTEVTLTGKIWGRDFARVVPVDPELTWALPAIALGTRDLEGELTDDEVTAAAHTTGAVSRMTSYLAEAPLAGPSVIGSVRGGTGCLGLSGISCGSRCGGFTRCRGVTTSIDGTPYVALLQGLLADGVAACKRAHGVTEIGGSVTIEATADEVVDVGVAAPTAELATCVQEAAWAIRLTGAFVRHRSYEVPLD